MPVKKKIGGSISSNVVVDLVKNPNATFNTLNAQFDNKVIGGRRCTKKGGSISSNAVMNLFTNPKTTTGGRKSSLKKGGSISSNAVQNLVNNKVGGKKTTKRGGSPASYAVNSLVSDSGLSFLNEQASSGFLEGGNKQRNNQRSNKLKGGSLGSDAINSLVNPNFYKDMDNMHTNIIQGGKKVSFKQGLKGGNDDIWGKVMEQFALHFAGHIGGKKLSPRTQFAGKVRPNKMNGGSSCNGSDANYLANARPVGLDYSIIANDPSFMGASARSTSMHHSTIANNLLTDSSITGDSVPTLSKQSMFGTPQSMSFMYGGKKSKK